MGRYVLGRLGGQGQRSTPVRDKLDVETPPDVRVRALIELLGIPAGMVWLVSVNGSLVGLDHPLSEGDDVLFLPPAGGGACCVGRRPAGVPLQPCRGPDTDPGGVSGSNPGRGSEGDARERDPLC
ncbi:MAG: MoaD/ThiS family protein [Firmicutes bacterium]|nr:MoaD/ThiS family protein [Bacillota bacterium]